MLNDRRVVLGQFTDELSVAFIFLLRWYSATNHSFRGMEVRRNSAEVQRCQVTSQGLD